MPIRSTAHGIANVIFSNLFITLPIPKGSLNGQTIVVTGANTGLGYESCKHLLRLGVTHLVMGVRNLEKGAKAKRNLVASTAREESCIEVWQVDMANYRSVHDFAARIAALPRLDALLANAGLYRLDFSMTQGDETQIAINVISTVLLCLLALPAMRKSAAQFNIIPRIVIPNSALHYVAPRNEVSGTGDLFADLNNAKTADLANRYALSKLLIIYAVRALAKKIDYAIINTPNPSYSGSSGLVGENPGLGLRISEKLLARSTEEGSRALVDGVLAGKESHGQYLTNCHVQIPSTLVTNAEGVRIQKVFFDQLVKKLESISPEVMQGV
ncbi:putative short-chain dehydrogenase [Amniculicola lignicola CBS 123094]|uniref:Putative short-chain dehydrogenase n=1 Tax=Amniculicola lignicola CBS 123094 TaxID=1392246 RepID=A0A6A5X5F1_9PLEO|nr:putative short-chain dehydrogenase [Amniculicola lignicola CBS 123094]